MATEEALIELARRYFTSHGPATLRDFAWWSGFTQADAKTALVAIGRAARQETVDRQEYWWVEADVPRPRAVASAWLLPNYDEYLVAYKDRAVIAAHDRHMFAHHLVVDGRVAGSWQPGAHRAPALVRPYTNLIDAHVRAVGKAIRRHLRFISD